MPLPRLRTRSDARPALERHDVGCRDLAPWTTAWGVWVGQGGQGMDVAPACPNPMWWGLTATPCSTSQTRVGRCRLEVAPCSSRQSGREWFASLRRARHGLWWPRAPLVPLADEMLFGDWDVALNLGGLPTSAWMTLENRVVAWDVGPANLLLNMLAQTVGLDMDRDGQLGRQGTVVPELLKTWQALPITPSAWHPRAWAGNGSRQGGLAARGTGVGGAFVEDVLATAVEYVATGPWPATCPREARCW